MPGPPDSFNERVPGRGPGRSSEQRSCERVLGRSAHATRLCGTSSRPLPPESGGRACSGNPGCWCNRCIEGCCIGHAFGGQLPTESNSIADNKSACAEEDSDYLRPTRWQRRDGTTVEDPQQILAFRLFALINRADASKLTAPSLEDHIAGCSRGAAAATPAPRLSVVIAIGALTTNVCRHRLADASTDPV